MLDDLYRMQETKNNPEPGTLVDGKYRLERLIGNGGMGDVFEAVQVAINRKVAVKLLREQHCIDPRVIERFQQEARLAASIGHDNICEVTDLGVHEATTPYLVMPVLRGQPLSALLKANNGPLPVARSSDIICQVLSALAAAHDAGIIHRDLKPDNIFMTTFGDRRDFVKLLDFGISKVTESDTVSELTQTGTVVGTAFYMAPEQAMGKKEIDHRLDIYAVGVILYELLTGMRPYTGDSYNEIIHKIVAEPFVAPTRIDPAIPKAIEAVIIQAMSKDPAARFSSASQMCSACREAADGSSSSPSRGSSPPTKITRERPPFTPVDEMTGDQRIAEPSPPISSPAWTRQQMDSPSQVSPRARARQGAIGIILLLLGTVLLLGILLAVWFHRTDAQPITLPVAAPEEPIPSPNPVHTSPAPVQPKENRTLSSESPDEKARLTVPATPKDDAAQSSRRTRKPKRKHRSEREDGTPLKVRGRAGTYVIIEDDN